jgi:hypothetical protein
MFVVSPASQRMEKIMPEQEPPSGSSSRFPRFLIGKDSRGRWVAQDQRGLSGGLFISQAEAVRYAMFESGRRPQAVIMVSGVLELDLARHAASGSQARRRAA